MLFMMNINTILLCIDISISRGVMKQICACSCRILPENRVLMMTSPMEVERIDHQEEMEIDEISKQANVWDRRIKLWA